MATFNNKLFFYFVLSLVGVGTSQTLVRDILYYSLSLKSYALRNIRCSLSFNSISVSPREVFFVFQIGITGYVFR